MEKAKLLFCIRDLNSTHEQLLSFGTFCVDVLQFSRFVLLLQCKKHLLFEA